MTRDQQLAEDIAVLLLGGPWAWEDAPNVQRIAALAIAVDAVTRARETGCLPVATVVPIQREGSHDDAA